MEDQDLKIIATPSVAPVLFDNPGYTIAKFNTDENDRIAIKDIQMTNFQLSSYILYSS